MTMPKVGGGAAAGGGQGPDVAGPEPSESTSGEFQDLLAEKESVRPSAGRAQRGKGSPLPGDALPDLPGGTPEGAARRRGRASVGGQGAGAPAETPGETPATPSERRLSMARDAALRELMRDPDAPARGGAAERGAMPGAPAPAGAALQPVATAQPQVTSAEAARSAEAVARVEQIAQQIVEAAEVRLHADGAVEARLQLDLGRAGQLNVALERSAEGQIRIVLEPTTARGAELLRSHGSELAQRLEARGLNIQELTVEASGETLLRVEGTPDADAPAGVAADPVATDPAAASDVPREQRERFDEPRDQRRRHAPEPEDDEETGG